MGYPASVCLNCGERKTGHVYSSDVNGKCLYESTFYEVKGTWLPQKTSEWRMWRCNACSVQHTAFNDEYDTTDIGVIFLTCSYCLIKNHLYAKKSDRVQAV